MAKNDRIIELTVSMTVRGTTESGRLNPKRIVTDDDLEMVAIRGVEAMSTDWVMMKVMDGSDCLATCIKSEIITSRIVNEGGID